MPFLNTKKFISLCDSATDPFRIPPIFLTVSSIYQGTRSGVQKFSRNSGLENYVDIMTDHRSKTVRASHTACMYTVFPQIYIKRSVQALHVICIGDIVKLHIFSSLLGREKLRQKS
jgi:hypothetical protein